MAKVLVSDQYLSDIADSIRNKLNSDDTYTPAQMSNAIDSFATDANATANDILSGKTAYTGAGKITGNIGNTSVSQGNTTVSGATATRGTASWGNGIISSGSIDAATFANSATSGTTYVDISNTTDAPVLVSGDALYINKGYVDNLKINLSKLVPHGASAGLAAGHILSGYSAYNNDGTLIAGNIASKSSANVTHSGKTVTIPAGYYGSQVTHDIDTGTVVASVSSNTSGSASVAATGFTASETATDYYVTLSTSAGSVKAQAAGGTAGYVTSSTTNETAATSVSVSGNGTKLYIPTGSASTPATTITATPVISVDASGLITASVSASKSVTPTVMEGYVASGSAGTVTASGSNTSQLTVKAATTYTPTTTNQTISAGTYLTGVQTIVGDTNLAAGNIVSGVTIFGIPGTYSIPAAAGHSF